MAVEQSIPVANPSFDLPGVLGLLYGVASPITYPGARAGTANDREAITFNGVQVVPDAEAYAMSRLGTPILMPITLLGGSYKRYASDGRVETVQVEDLRLPASSVTEMSVSKSITKTQVSASGASVKEVFSYGDWDMRISGIILDEEKHPQNANSLEEMEERLLGFDRLADSIGVRADLFARRGIDRLVIRSINFNQVPGKPRWIGFQMQCESDAPLELLIRT